MQLQAHKFAAPRVRNTGIMRMLVVESRSSIEQGSPVVSMSIGNTVEFMFGDTRGKSKASKINLDSGDVLIFGGESRLLFHGISHLRPHTAPTWLKVETGLRPGRLNLTFRQY